MLLVWMKVSHCLSSLLVFQDSIDIGGGYRLFVFYMVAGLTSSGNPQFRPDQTFGAHPLACFFKLNLIILIILKSSRLLSGMMLAWIKDKRLSVLFAIVRFKFLVLGYNGPWIHTRSQQDMNRQLADQSISSPPPDSKPVHSISHPFSLTVYFLALGSSNWAKLIGAFSNKLLPFSGPCKPLASWCTKCGRLSLHLTPCLPPLWSLYPFYSYKFFFVSLKVFIGISPLRNQPWTTSLCLHNHPLLSLTVAICTPRSSPMTSSATRTKLRVFCSFRCMRIPYYPRVVRHLSTTQSCLIHFTLILHCQIRQATSP